LDEVGEGGKFEQEPVCGGLGDGLFFQHPGEVVGKEDGVHPCGKRGVDVGLGAVADHPCAVEVAGVAGGEGAIGGGVFFGEDLNSGEVCGQAGSGELVVLLDWIAFGNEEAAVTSGQLGESGSNVREQLDLVVGDGLCKAENTGVLLRGNGRVGELFEAVDQRAAEALESVAVRGDGGVFHTVEVGANLAGSVSAVIEIGDERRDGTFEVDVVFPQRVVGVDQKGLTGRLALWGVVGGHKWIIWMGLGA